MISLPFDIQHPDEIPIQLCSTNSTEQCHSPHQLRLLCQSTEQFNVGSWIKIHYPSLDQFAQPIRGFIQAITLNASDFTLAILFSNPDDLMRMRMLEQQAQIHVYQLKSQLQGRKIDLQQAALEWIERHAAQFPSECV